MFFFVKLLYDLCYYLERYRDICINIVKIETKNNSASKLNKMVDKIM